MERRRYKIDAWLRTALTLLTLTVSTSAFSQTPKVEVEINALEFYGRVGCYFCQQGKAYLQRLSEQYPDLLIVYYDIEQQPEALQRLEAKAQEQGVEQAAVPAFIARDVLIVGYGGESTEKRIEAVLFGGGILGGGNPDGSSETCAVTPVEPCDEGEGEREFDIPIVGKVRPSDLGLPTFTIILGLIDGFNPCAMWVLLFLLSLLVNLKSRVRMAMIAGTFVLVSGLAYFAFMAAWLNFFLIVGVSRYVQIFLGCFAVVIGSVHVKDFFAFKRGLSFSIPESAKPGIYKRASRILRAENLAAAMVATIALAVLVNVVELACTAGLPVNFTEVLISHDLERWQYYAYLALYNLAYMFDDGLMVGVCVFTLSRHKLQEQGGRWLKLVSGLAISLLGLVMLFAPQWLSWS